MWTIRIFLGVPGYDKEATCDNDQCRLKKGKLTWCEYCPIYKNQESKESETRQCVVCGKKVTHDFIGEETGDGVLCAGCACKGYYFHYGKDGEVIIKNEKGEHIDAPYL